jgi:hypothetical protein
MVFILHYKIERINFTLRTKYILFLQRYIYIYKHYAMCHMLRYVYIEYRVECAECLMEYEAKYFLTVRFLSCAMIRLASAVN